MPTSFIDRTTRLLLVDDEPVNLMMLENVLETHLKGEIEFSSLTDPQEAHQWIENNIVDILITDLEMPGINGIELLRLCKQRNPLTQVYFMTGRSTLNALTEALELGATDYFLKPLDPDDLIELITDSQKRVRRWREALKGTFLSNLSKRTQEV